MKRQISACGPDFPFRQPTLRRGHNAFTLVEILTVIFIIALLAAIIFPVLSQAREKGRQSSCLSNMRQLGMGLLLYRHDYDEQFPVAVDTPDHGVFIWNSKNPEVHKALENAPTLKITLSPYIANEPLWRCPSDIGGNRIAYRAADRDNIVISRVESSFYGILGSSYIYRAEAGFAGLVEATKATNMADREISVSEIILLADGRAWHMTQQPNAVTDYLLETEKNPGFRNSFFADGHAKLMSEHAFASSWIGGLGSQ